MGCGNRKIASLLERSFVEELDLERWGELRAHLAGCDGCREDYDRLAALERAMAGTADPLPARHLDLIGQSVLRKVGAAPREAGAGWRRWLALAVPAAAAATAGVLILVRSGPGPADGFQARAAGAVHPEGVRAFCITEGADGARIRAASDLRQGADLRCRVSDQLQFSYTSGERAGYLAIVSLPEARDGEALLYTDAEHGPSFPVQPGKVDEPLPFSTRLQARHAPGKRRLVALFTERALAKDEAEAFARELAFGAPERAPVETRRAAWLVIE